MGKMKGSFNHEYRKQRPSKRRLTAHKRRLEESITECPECKGFWEECDNCLGADNFYKQERTKQ